MLQDFSILTGVKLELDERQQVWGVGGGQGQVEGGSMPKGPHVGIGDLQDAQPGGWTTFRDMKQGRGQKVRRTVVDVLNSDGKGGCG